MKLDELEEALQDAARRQARVEVDIYPTVVRTARRRRTTRRTGAIALAAGCVVMLIVTGVAVTKSGDSSPTRVHVAQSPTSEFRPPSHTEGDKLVVPITFLSGGTAEVVLPSAAVHAHALTFTPGGAITWEGQPDLGRTVEVAHGTFDSVFPGQSPLAVYAGATSKPVRYYQGPQDLDVNYLAFQFGDWVVKVWDYPIGDARGATLTDDQRQVLATHLIAHVTPDGFLVLDPQAPLANSTTDTPDGRLDAQTNSLGIIFRSCTEAEQNGAPTPQGYIATDGAPGRVLCDPRVPLVMWLVGSPSFRQGAELLELRKLTGPLPQWHQ